MSLFEKYLFRIGAFGRSPFCHMGKSNKSFLYAFKAWVVKLMTPSYLLVIVIF